MSKNVTLALPDDLAEEMARFTHIRWSEVARRAFRRELERLKLFDQLLAESKLTEEDAVAIGREVRHKASARLRERLGRGSTAGRKPARRRHRPGRK